MSDDGPGELRLFVALDLPEAHRREIGERADRLRSRLPPARWVRADGLHLTLAFLGGVASGRVPELEAAVAPVFTDARPLTVTVADGGTFPPGRPARVAWVGLRSGPDLPALQRAVAMAALGSLGMPSEAKPFHPHVTLARPRRPWSRRAADEFARAFAGEIGEPFLVTEGVLYRSELGPGGSRYTAVGRFPLGGVTREDEGSDP